MFFINKIKMDISKYASYFHDGGIIDINQFDDRIEILMESSQLHLEWNEDNIPLSSSQTIKGKLCLEKTKNIFINNKISKDFKMTYDDGEIMKFRVYDSNKKILLLIIWSNYPPKERISNTELIEIEAERIYWENIPDLLDPMNLSDRE